LNTRRGQGGYRELSEKAPGMRLFQKAWWLDAVCIEEAWDAVVLESDGAIIGGWPYVPGAGGLIVRMPLLTQFMGPFLLYPEGQKYARRLAFEKEALSAMADALPSTLSFSQNASRDFSNWLPLFWKGFKQTTRYTYVIEDLRNLAKVEAEFLDTTRRKIRKAARILKVEESWDIGVLYSLVSLTFGRQGKAIPYPAGLLDRINAACSAHAACRLLVARDEGGKAHACVFTVRDATTTYYLMGGADPALRNSNASSLLMREAIALASRETNDFDFEGSMIEDIERFFRSFGAVQKQYFSLSRAGRIVRALKALRS
jgi:hypothetical protein